MRDLQHTFQFKIPITFQPIDTVLRCWPRCSSHTCSEIRAAVSCKTLWLLHCQMIYANISAHASHSLHNFFSCPSVSTTSTSNGVSLNVMYVGFTQLSSCTHKGHSLRKVETDFLPAAITPPHTAVCRSHLAVACSPLFHPNSTFQHWTAVCSFREPTVSTRKERKAPQTTMS